MTMLAPMTFIVTLALILAVVIGVSVLLRAMGRNDQTQQDLKLGTQQRCPQCQEPNPTHAQFCGKCGKPLG